MSHYLFPLPIADCKRCLPRQLCIIVIIFLLPIFMYIYHLISIDLQLSHSFNSHTLQSLQL
ncbi:uncharacterized protein K441DRAFT_204732 [Cenococcum geophilum 1.58]|uniref:uncharacterized protein n=1 Tax=Cenococcum geophilum 1.58 TaxID=794803 RepID=UPI00358ED870|nr:hypothetical protein K441DRAFT_204732 [Cenococcum geophilum 1.58]